MITHGEIKIKASIDAIENGVEKKIFISNYTELDPVQETEVPSRKLAEHTRALYKRFNGCI